MKKTSENFDGKQPTIFVFNHSASLYGAEKSLLDILIGSKSEFKYVVFSPSDGPMINQFKINGFDTFENKSMRWLYWHSGVKVVDVLKQPLKLKRFLIYPYLITFFSFFLLPLRVHGLYKIAKAKNVALVYTNTLTVLDGAILARFLKVPHIWHVRESILGNTDLCSFIPEHIFVGWILKLSTKVIANSISLKNKLFGAYASNKVIVIHNGVNLSRYSPKRITNITQSNHPFKVAICGSIIERKDVKTFIKAAELVLEQISSVQFLVIGENKGEYYNSILTEITGKKVSQHLTFTGHIENTHDVFKDIDVLVSTAIYEPFGKTIIEAMATGLPVISTKSGGPEEIVIDNQTGFLVAVGDFRAVADKLLWLINHPDEAKKMGLAGRVRVENTFELKKSINQVVSCFRVILNNQPQKC